MLSDKGRVRRATRTPAPLPLSPVPSSSVTAWVELRAAKSPAILPPRPSSRTLLPTGHPATRIQSRINAAVQAANDAILPAGAADASSRRHGNDAGRSAACPHHPDAMKRKSYGRARATTPTPVPPIRRRCGWSMSATAAATFGVVASSSCSPAITRWSKSSFAPDRLLPSRRQNRPCATSSPAPSARRARSSPRFTATVRRRAISTFSPPTASPANSPTKQIAEILR